jgi:8-oxo-dGTP diphosphatase
MVVVVGAAVLQDHPPRVLASRRTAPAHLAGLWEFPGGKLDAGESDQQALIRELEEELGVVARVGERIGPDLLIGETAVLRVYLATIEGELGTIEGEPQLLDHDEHRWLSADELDDVPWIPVDAPVVEELRALLSEPAEDPRR